jgi:hypothetical protein
VVELSLSVMTPKRPVEFFYVPCVWPAFAISTGAAILVWGLALSVGHREAFRILAAVIFWVGLLAGGLSARRKVGVVPLALPSNSMRLLLIRASIGLCWGAVLFSLLCGR